MFRARQVMDGLSGSLAATLLCSCIGVAAGARGTYVAGPTKGRSASTAYAIRVGNGPALGRVRVWSAGVTHAGEDDLLVDVHLRIRNDSDAEMQLDVRATELQLIADDGSDEAPVAVERVPMAAAVNGGGPRDLAEFRSRKQGVS